MCLNFILITVIKNAQITIKCVAEQPNTAILINCSNCIEPESKFGLIEVVV